MRKAVKLTTLLALLLVLTITWSYTVISFTHKTVASDELLEAPILGASEHANKTIIFVHVGKTGGETIKWRLKVICNLRGSQRKKARCKEQFSLGESQLSRQTIGYTHCGSQRPRQSMERATSFLFSIRDPIVRSILVGSVVVMLVAFHLILVLYLITISLCFIRYRIGWSVGFSTCIL